jgi:mono/diheme cytochrome c family protein
MIFSKPLAQKYILTRIPVLKLHFVINAQEGKALFQQNCQNCHALDKQLTGPALRGFLNRGPWGDRKSYTPGSTTRPAFMATDPYTQGLKASTALSCRPFPTLPKTDRRHYRLYRHRSGT